MTVFYFDDFPTEAIEDCSRAGQDASEAVAFWTDELSFEVDAHEARECLRGYGAWTDGELADDAANVQKFFWLMMGDFNEWDGTDDSPSGSDIFSTE